MPRHYVNPSAMCPFYRMEDPNSIFCEGIGPKWTIRLTKDGKGGSARGYKKKFCYDDWKNCPISRMLQKKFE